MMKLYIYDHCPFCVRTQMIFGLHHIPVEKIVLAYDDETTPIELIGKKVVPILIKENGEPMGESLDIVNFIDEQVEQERLITDIRPEIKTWLEKIRPFYTKLTSPREIRIGLPEFKHQSAIDYFVNKKTPFYGNFEDNLSQTKAYLMEVQPLLIDLENMIFSAEHIGEKLGYEDIHIFPLLRNLTIVKSIEFPEKVHKYIQTMSKNTGILLYEDKAI